MSCCFLLLSLKSIFLSCFLFSFRQPDFILKIFLSTSQLWLLSKEPLVTWWTLMSIFSSESKYPKKYLGWKIYETEKKTPSKTQKILILQQRGHFLITNRHRLESTTIIWKEEMHHSISPRLFWPIYLGLELISDQQFKDRKSGLLFFSYLLHYIYQN